MGTSKDSLNFSGLSSIYKGVRFFRNTVFALVAMLWLPASAHCQMEVLAGFELLQCAENSSPCHTDSGHGDSGCCAVEKSQYKPDRARLEMPSPPYHPVPFVLLSVLEERFPEDGAAAIPDSVPPELPKVWHFVSRTALPPRAPSAAS